MEELEQLVDVILLNREVRQCYYAGDQSPEDRCEGKKCPRNDNGMMASHHEFQPLSLDRV